MKIELIYLQCIRFQDQTLSISTQKVGLLNYKNIERGVAELTQRKQWECNASLPQNKRIRLSVSELSVEPRCLLIASKYRHTHTDGLHVLNHASSLLYFSLERGK